jgi:hypothetical protein
MALCGIVSCEGSVSRVLVSWILDSVFPISFFLVVCRDFRVTVFFGFFIPCTE